MNKTTRALALIGLAVFLGAADAGEEVPRLPVFQPSPSPAAPRASPLLGTQLEPIVRLGQSLYQAGILPRLRYVQSFAANPTGGLAQGTDTSGVVIFGADADLGKLAGLNGAQVHATFAQFYGHELSSDFIGSRTKVQSFYYPRKQFELTEFTYEQSLFNKQLDIVVGRANATGQFARSTYGCRFQNVADCPFELTQAVGAFPGFPYVNWGGYVRYNPVPAIYVKAGAFETNSVRNTNNGFDWGLEHSTGYVVPFEVGYGTEYETDPYPRHYKIGGWYNSAPYNDPYLSTRNRSRALFGGAPLAYSGGRRGAYALGDQVVWRPDTGPGQRGIAVFATAGVPFDGEGIFSFQGVAGGIWTGPFPGRPADQIGILATYIRLSDKEDGYVNELLRRAGSNSFVSRNQGIFEANYNYRVTNGVFLAGSLQYLVNPDPINRPTAKFAPKDALVIGLKLSISVNQLLGLPLGLVSD
ncbi:MAG: carbohydrate porin [Acetobacteraceae bacterium]|nr:carbohydrate porin [Acetobacteraceae bacterium]